MKTLIKQSNFFRALLVMFFTELFKFLVFVFLVLFLIESLLPGFAGNHFHLSYVLLIALLSAIVVLVLQKEIKVKERFGGWWIIFTWAIALALIIAIKAVGIGAWRYLLGFASFVVFVLVYKALVNYERYGEKE